MLRINYYYFLAFFLVFFLLSSHNKMDIFRRFIGQTQLSYEIAYPKHTIPPENYDMVIAIPHGKKALFVCSYNDHGNVAIIAELTNIITLELQKPELWIETKNIPLSLARGTVAYGTIMRQRKRKTGDNEFGTFSFVLEDLIRYNGWSLSGRTVQEKLPLLKECMSFCTNWPIRLPHMSSIPFEIGFEYPVHHFQYRHSALICPFINMPKVSETVCEENNPLKCLGSLPKRAIPYNTKKPQYRQTTVFLVEADEEADIYHLYAMNRVYCGVAAIISLSHSKQMNVLFRTYGKKTVLDYLDESDDEDSFQNIRSDKYIYPGKQLHMECVFSKSFQKWIPLTAMDNAFKESIVAHRHL